MHLPFLPLCPTAAGTNDAEAARRAVIGNEDLLALILAAANSGNVEEACALAENWCATHNDPACRNDGPMWKTLLEAVFPKAVTPVPPDPHWPDLGVEMPANAKQRFFDMCRRHRQARLVEERYKGRKELYSQYTEALRKLREELHNWATSMGTSNRNVLREHRGYRRLETKIEQIERNRTRLKSVIEDMEDRELEPARNLLTHWNKEPPKPPRVRRQNAMRGPILNAFGAQGPVPPADPFPTHTDDEDEDEDDLGINPALFGDNEDD